MIRWTRGLCLALLVWTACTSPNPTSTPSTLTPSTATLTATSFLSPRATTPESFTPTPLVTAPCPATQVLPQLTQTQPQRVAHGASFKVIGVGGYVRDTCGGINESARTFPVYLDDQPIGTVECYVNRCEGTFQIPIPTPPGSHCLSVEVGQCPLEIQVIGN